MCLPGARCWRPQCGGRGALLYAEPIRGDLAQATLPPGHRSHAASHPTTAMGTGGCGTTLDWVGPHSLAQVVLPSGWALVAKCPGQLEGIQGTQSTALPWDLPRRDA